MTGKITISNNQLVLNLCVFILITHAVIVLDGFEWIAIISSALRYLVFLYLALMIASRFIEVNPRTMITLTIMTALPSGTMNVIYSERYNCASKFCARTVVMTLVFMVVTLPLLIGLCLRFLMG